MGNAKAKGGAKETCTEERVIRIEKDGTRSLTIAEAADGGEYNYVDDAMLENDPYYSTPSTEVNDGYLTFTPNGGASPMGQNVADNNGYIEFAADDGASANGFDVDDNDGYLDARSLTIAEAADGGEYNYIDDAMLENDPYYSTPSTEVNDGYLTFTPNGGASPMGQYVADNNGYIEFAADDGASANGFDVDDNDGYLDARFCKTSALLK